MTVDAERRIEMGRSWRDLPAAPPESDVIPAVAPAHQPDPAEFAGADSDADTVPLPAVPPAAPAGTDDAHSWPWVIGLAAAIAMVAVLFAWAPWSDGTAADAAGVAGSGLVEDTDGAGGSPGAADEPVADVASSLLPSVVQIEQAGAFGAVGSGFVYEKGRVLTAAHVVAGAREVVVRTSDGRNLTGTVLGGDALADIAVVAIDLGVPAAPLALGDPPEVGQLAVAIGSPLGFEQSVTSGIVSAVDREMVLGGAVLDGLIQTDAPINQGNSGGPLADRSGRVIGVNVAIATASGGSDGIGFAVAIDKAVAIAAEFKTQDPRPESLDPGSGGLFDYPELFPPGFGDFFGDFFGGEGDPFGDLDGLLDEFFGTPEPGESPFGDLDRLLDELFGGQGLADPLDPDAAPLTPGLLDFLRDLLQGNASFGDGELPPELEDLLDLFRGEG